ncbi:hypothetical protein Tco_0785161 [Tanacetum coccineum]
MGLPRLLLDKREVMWPLSWPWKGLSSWVSCYKFPVFTAGVPVRLVFLLGLLALAMAAVYASRAAVKSAISCRMASKVMAGVSNVDVLLGGILST